MAYFGFVRNEKTGEYPYAIQPCECEHEDHFFPDDSSYSFFMNDTKTKGFNQCIVSHAYGSAASTTFHVELGHICDYCAAHCATDLVASA